MILSKLQQSLGRGPRVENDAFYLAACIYDLFRPKTVIDIGCGGGALGRMLQEKDIKVLGIDKQIPARIPYIQADLARSFPVVEQKFDVAICLELAEHLPADKGGALVAWLITLAPIVVFAAGIPRQGGYGHINEQWQSEWALLFRYYNYFPHTNIRNMLWNHQSISPWYLQDTLIYCTEETAGRYALVMDGPLDIVHPRSWLHIGPMGVWQRIKSYFK